jgi:hypothetical protein
MTKRFCFTERLPPARLITHQPNAGVHLEFILSLLHAIQPEALFLGSLADNLDAASSLIELKFNELVCRMAPCRHNFVFSQHSP